MRVQDWPLTDAGGWLDSHWTSAPHSADSEPLPPLLQRDMLICRQGKERAISECEHRWVGVNHHYTHHQSTQLALEARSPWSPIKREVAHPPGVLPYSLICRRPSTQRCTYSPLPFMAASYTVCDRCGLMNGQLLRRLNVRSCPASLPHHCCGCLPHPEARALALYHGSCLRRQHSAVVATLLAASETRTALQLGTGGSSPRVCKN